MDPKYVVREWNREIEAENRSRERRPREPWKAVVWLVLELLWCVVLVAMVVWVRRLQW